MGVLTRLRSAAAEVFDGADVQFGLLFGSHARGEAHTDSDVDIAVHFAPTVPPDEYLSRSLDLAGRLAYRSGAGPIDGPVVLNEAPLRLAGRVLRDRATWSRRWPRRGPPPHLSSDRPARIPDPR